MIYSIAVDDLSESNMLIDFLTIIFRPLIVCAPDAVKAAQIFKEIFKIFLIYKIVSPKKTAAK